MACYNVARTLPTAVESILGQTLRNLEFIIVDDASTDHTAPMLRSYAERDSRVRLHTNPVNGGLAACLNHAIGQARARYVARMDADDYSFPDRLARQMAFMEAHPSVDVLGTGTELVDENGHRIGTLILPAGHRQIVAQRYLRPLFVHPSVLFRQTFFDRWGYYDERLRKTEDLDLWLRAQTLATYHNLPDVLFRYTYVPTKPLRTLYSDLAVRWRHMRASGELVGKGHELLLYALRFAWLRVTNRTGTRPNTDLAP